jgi:5-methyltetrahydrofolate--homocysteine methyltransferase
MMTLDMLLSRPCILFDGGTGTEYQKRGLPVGAAPELWVIQQPEKVMEVHRAYVEAGAQVIETCTFGASRPRLSLSELSTTVREVNVRAVELAQEAAGGDTLVAGSVGPLGVILEPYGDMPVDEAEGVFTEQIGALVESGADLVLIETMLSLQEALLAARVAKKCGAPAVGVTMTYESTPHGPRTSFGETVAAVTAALEQEGVTFIGSNCGSGFDLMRTVAREYRQATKMPLLMQSNAGIPSVDQSGRNVYPESAESFGRFAAELRSVGISMIGGCCGTTPAHIAEARTHLFG